ncbi:unnamed protein product [Urochloa humidicola]
MTNPSHQSTRRKRADEPAAASSSFPPWVMLETYVTREVKGCPSSIADSNTLAASHTTGGLPISVSLRVVAPPEGSRVSVQLPAGANYEQNYSCIRAAHGDSMVIDIRLTNEDQEPVCADHFVYNAAAGTPSLLLVPAHYVTDEKGRPMRWPLEHDGTGLLRRGEDDFVVAALSTVYERIPLRKNVAELRMFRSGEWSVTRPPIDGDDDGEGVLSSWQNHIVIPVRDELCWVDLSRGLLLCKVFDESPGLRYVPLPVDPASFLRPSLRNVCITGGGSTIKFVNIFARCCCGVAATTRCPHSRHAYTVHTWTLRMDDMTWVMDSVLDATQLWALDDYKGLPRVELDYPIVSMDDPHAICFTVCERMHEKGGDGTVWRIAVDMRSKTLQSVLRDPQGSSCEHQIPSRVSSYFDSKEPMQCFITSKKIKLQMNNDGASVKEPQCELSSDPMETMKPASHEATILAALEEIPGLDRVDVLKAYRILSHEDSGCRFRSLMGLPMSLRKDCVLMDIKASEACVVCSACSAELQL